MDVNLNNNLPQPDPKALEQSEALSQLIREEIIQEGGSISFGSQCVFYHPRCVEP